MGKKEIASLYPTRFLGSSKQFLVVEKRETKIREDKRGPLIFNTGLLQLPIFHTLLVNASDPARVTRNSQLQSGLLRAEICRTLVYLPVSAQ